MAPRDGIEVHFDESNGRLDLACEADAFAAHRELARSQVGTVAEIPFDKVQEINVTDSDAARARRDAAKWGTRDAGIVVLAVVVLGLAVVGAYALATGKID